MAKTRSVILAHTEHGVVVIGRNNGGSFDDKHMANGAEKALRRFYEGTMQFETVNIMPVHEILEMGRKAKVINDGLEAATRRNDQGDDQRMADIDGDTGLLSAPTPLSVASCDPVPEVPQEDAVEEGPH